MIEIPIGFTIGYGSTNSLAYKYEKDRLVALQAVYQDKQKILSETVRPEFYIDSRIVRGIRFVFDGLGRYIARRKFIAGKFDNEVDNLHSIIEGEIESLRQSGEKEHNLDYGGLVRPTAQINIKLCSDR